MVTKQSLINGLSNYVHQQMIPSITDMWSRRIMDGLVDLMVMKPEYFDRFISQYPFLDMFCVDGKYDIDTMEEVIQHNIENYGAITLHILGGSYTFDGNDIASIRRMI